MSNNQKLETIKLPEKKLTIRIWDVKPVDHKGTFSFSFRSTWAYTYFSDKRILQEVFDLEAPRKFTFKAYVRQLTMVKEWCSYDADVYYYKVELRVSGIN